MTTENLNSGNLKVNSLVADVSSWHDAMATKGIIGTAVATQRKTALKQIVSVLGDDEEFGIEGLLEVVPELGNRWCRKHAANPNTANAYVKRAAKALDDYIRYQANPSSFKPARSQASNKPRQAKRTPDEPPAEAKSSATESTTPSVPSTTSSPGTPVLRDCPLGNGREFRFILPDRKLTFGEVRRIANHLWTLSEYFDPNEPSAFDHASRDRDAAQLSRE